MPRPKTNLQRNELLNKYWEESGRNRDRFYQLIQNDEYLKKWTLNALRYASRSLPSFSTTISSRYAFSGLKDPDKEDLLSLLREKTLDDVYADKRFSNFTERQLRNYAQSMGISVSKSSGASKSDSTPIYSQWLKELIQSGDFAEVGLAKAYELVKDEYPEATIELDLDGFRKKVEEIIWISKVEKSLLNIVSLGLPIEKFHRFHPYIPLKMVRDRAEHLKGASVIQGEVPFFKGLGRLGDFENADPSYEFPNTSITSPLVVISTNEPCSIDFANGANIGLKHRRSIRENRLRLALVYAERREHKAVILCNPFDIDMKKAAQEVWILRAMISGLNMNLNLLDSTYRKKARKIRKEKKYGQLIYTTIAERFVDMLSGLAKIVINPEAGKPEFSGTILIPFGYKEESIVATAVNAELRYLTLLKQREIKAEVKAIESALGRAMDNKDVAEIRRLRRELVAMVNEESRTILTGVDTEYKQEYVRRVRSFIVSKIESTIPNAKVIGQGTTYIRVGDEVIEINIPHNVRVTDAHLANYVKGYGAAALMGKVAKTVVICPPWSLGYKMTVREIFMNGKPEKAKIMVAPMTVDGKFLREALKESVRNVHPVSRTLQSAQFKTGILTLNFSNGMVNPEEVSIDTLLRELDREFIPGPYGGTKFIHTIIATDQHMDARSRNEVWCESRQCWLGVVDAAIQMMRDAGLCKEDRIPIHLYSANDDFIQGNHYETQFRPDNRERSYSAIEEMLTDLKRQVEDKIRTALPEEVIKVVETMRQKSLEQFRARGSDYPQTQMIDVLDRHIEPNIDFFSSVIRRAEKSGLDIKGVSYYRGSDFDQSDLGVINLGSGNHMAATVKDRLTEGWIYARYLQALLRGQSDWWGGKDYIQKVVRAPQYGNQFFAWGSITVPGGYTWAVELRSDPTRLSSWADPLLAAVRLDPARGTYNPILPERVAIKVVGDKHFDTAASTDYAIYRMGAAGTHSDPYGELGFPPNNSGVSFVSVPIDGPDGGPILYRLLHLVDILRYFEKPYDFDWESFLPNPV